MSFSHHKASSKAKRWKFLSQRWLSLDLSQTISVRNPPHHKNLKHVQISPGNSVFNSSNKSNKAEKATARRLFLSRIKNQVSGPEKDVRNRDRFRGNWGKTRNARPLIKTRRLDFSAFSLLEQQKGTNQKAEDAPTQAEKLAQKKQILDSWKNLSKQNQQDPGQKWSETNKKNKFERWRI